MRSSGIGKFILHGEIAIALLFVTINVMSYLNLAADDECVNHWGKARHKHAHLTILAQNKSITIPANIGIDGKCMASLHTHDTSGTIHIESYNKNKWFSVADFFAEWQREDDFERVANVSF